MPTFSLSTKQYNTVHQTWGQNLHTMEKIYISLSRLYFSFSAIISIISGQSLVGVVIFGVVHCWCRTINCTQGNMLHYTSVEMPPIIKARIELAFMPVMMRNVVCNFKILVLLIQRVEFALAGNWSSIESLY